MQKIYAAGYPLGKFLSDDLKFTDGIVSSLKGLEDNTNQITITAALNPGNSGVPVVNENGEVVGVAVSGLAKDLTEGINFAIKSETVKTFLKSNKIKPSSSFYSKKLDSDDLLENPYGMVEAYCDTVGIPFIKRALSWEPGARDEVSWWDGGSFHEDLRNSDGLKPQKCNYVEVNDLPDRVKEIYDIVMPHYEHLYAHRLIVSTI